MGEAARAKVLVPYIIYSYEYHRVKESIKPSPVNWTVTMGLEFKINSLQRW